MMMMYAYLPPFLSGLKPLLEFLQGHLPPRWGDQWLRLAFVPRLIGILQDHFKGLAGRSFVQAFDLQVWHGQNPVHTSTIKRKLVSCRSGIKLFLSCLLSDMSEERGDTSHSCVSALFSEVQYLEVPWWLKGLRHPPWTFLVHMQLGTFATCRCPALSYINIRIIFL